MVKGFIKTMEASIAIVLILVSIVFLFTQVKAYEPQVSDAGYNCLKNLDDRGKLSYYAENGLEANLNSDLRGCVPPLFNYAVEICTTPRCITTLPSDRAVSLSSYLIAGDNSFNPTLVNLWIWLA